MADGKWQIQNIWNLEFGIWKFGIWNLESSEAWQATESD
jgi:hypothetical protein